LKDLAGEDASFRIAVHGRTECLRVDSSTSVRNRLSWDSTESSERGISYTVDLYYELLKLFELFEVCESLDASRK
jgi:hypothetical protein